MGEFLLFGGSPNDSGCGGDSGGAVDQYCFEPSEYSRALEHVHSSMHVAVPFPEAADVSARSFDLMPHSTN